MTPKFENHQDGGIHAPTSLSHKGESVSKSVLFLILCWYDMTHSGSFPWQLVSSLELTSCGSRGVQNVKKFEIELALWFSWFSYIPIGTMPNFRSKFPWEVPPQKYHILLYKLYSKKSWFLKNCFILKNSLENFYFPSHDGLLWVISQL